MKNAAHIFNEWREVPYGATVSGPNVFWHAEYEGDDAIEPQAIYSIVMEPEGEVHLETPETGSDLPEKVTALKVKLADREDLVSIDTDSVKLTWYGDDPYNEVKEQKPVTGMTMGSTNYGAMLSLSLNGLKYDRAGGTDFTEAPDIILSDAWYDFGFDDEDWTSGFDLYDEKGEKVDEETGLIGFREGEYDPETGEESGALLYAFYGTTEAARLLSVEGAGSFSLPEGKEKNKASLTELLKDSANSVTVWVDDLSISSMEVDWDNAKVEDFVPDSLNDQIATVTGSLIIPKLRSGGMVEGEKDAVDTELYRELYDIPGDEDIPVTAEIFVPGAEHSAYPSASPDEGTVYKPDPGESLQIHLSPGEENEEVYYTLMEVEDWEKDYDTIPLSFTYDESKKSYIPDSGAIKYVQGSEDTEETEILLDGTKDAIIQIAGLTPGKQPSDIKVLRYYFEKQYAVICDGDRAAIDGLTIKRGETLRSEVLPQIPADFTYAEDNEIPLDKRITDPAGSKFRISLIYNPDPDTYQDTWTEGEVTVLGDDALPIAVLPEGYQDMLNNLFISKGEKLVTIKDQLPEGVLFPDKETEEMIIDNEPGSLRTIKLTYNPDSTKFRPLTVYGEVRVFGPGLAPGEEDMAVIRALKLKRGSTLSDLTGLPPFFFIHPDEDVDKVHNEPVGTSFEVALVYRPDPGAYDPTKVNGRVTIVSDDGQEFPGSADAADYLGSKGGKAKASLVSRDAKSITFKLADADLYLKYSYIIDFDGSKHMADPGGKTSNGKRASA